MQVTGKGSFIKADPDDTKSTLPNIHTQAGLAGGRFEAREVPADDLDGAFFVMRATNVELAGRFPGARFIAAYTGGFKTMAAAQVCAALEGEEIALQFVAGARPNLLRVALVSARPLPATMKSRCRSFGIRFLERGAVGKLPDCLAHWRDTGALPVS